MRISTKRLSKLAPFNALGAEYLERVRDRSIVKKLSKGSMLFKREMNCDQAYYLLEGQIDLIGNNYDVVEVKKDSERALRPLNDVIPTDVSAIAKQTSAILCLDHDFLDLVMAWSQSGDFSLTALKDQQVDVEEEPEQGDWMSSLLHSPLFQQIPPANIQQLFVNFEEVEVPAGQAIVRESEPGDFFYVVAAGQLAVTNRNGNLNVTLKAGNYFGEEALIGDTTRNATVAAQKDCVLMRLDKEQFKALLQDPIIRHTSLAELKANNLKAIVSEIIDVRLPFEYKAHHVMDSRNIPLIKLRERLSQFSSDTNYLVTDDGGRRSEIAVHLLCQAGFNASILNESSSLYSH